MYQEVGIDNCSIMGKKTKGIMKLLNCNYQEQSIILDN